MSNSGAVGFFETKSDIIPFYSTQNIGSALAPFNNIYVNNSNFVDGITTPTLNLTGLTAAINSTNGFSVNGIVQFNNTIDVPNIAMPSKAGITLNSQSQIAFTNKSTVTQTTSITTGVTLNDMCGFITTVSASIAAGNNATFQVLNNLMTGAPNPNPYIIARVIGGSWSQGIPICLALNATTSLSGGGYSITIQNVHPTQALNGTVMIGILIV